jgi:predicted MFS family arabinose efflux permease
VLGFISTFCGIPLLTLLPVFAKDTFHMGARGYSFMMATSGAGAITGALLYAGLARRERHGVLALQVQIVFSVLLICFALSHNLIVSFVALFLAGACLITLFSSITSMVQMNISEELRGRVMSIFMLAFRGGMPLGSLISGQLADRFSAPTALVALSVLLGTTALAFFFSSSGVKEL